MPREVKLYECKLCGERYADLSGALECEKRKSQRVRFAISKQVYFLYSFSRDSGHYEETTETEKIPAVVLARRRLKPSKIQEERYAWRDPHDWIYTIKIDGNHILNAKYDNELEDGEELEGVHQSELKPRI